MLADLLNRPVTIVRRVTSDDVDDYGNEIPAETYLDVLAELQQVRRAEPGGEGELSSEDWRGFFAPGTVLTTADAVLDPEFGEFELVGDPWPATSARTGRVSHVEVSLRQVGGAGGGS